MSRSIFDPLPIRRWPGDMEAEKAYIMQELERAGMKKREGNSSLRSVLTNAEMVNIVAGGYDRADKFLKNVRSLSDNRFFRERPDQLRYALSVSLVGVRMY